MRKKILIVDDTQTVLMSEKMMLAGYGFDILFAKTGLEAIDKAHESHPDLILLDIQMPELDGVEACRRLKENPMTQNIPIVIVTTKGNPEMVEASFMAGCDDFLTKPIMKVELLAKVKSFLA